MNDLVSVIMPSYNTADYISESIKSVQAQTYTNWELIIVDDCSTDNTDEVVGAFLGDQRIRYLKNKKKQWCGSFQKPCVTGSQGPMDCVLRQ